MSNLTRVSNKPQFRCLPALGGCHSSEPLRFALNVPGCRDEVNHSFVSWAVGSYVEEMAQGGGKHESR